MELLQEVANISGKAGLYRIIKPSRAGVIVETLDESKKREMVSANAKVSVLKEISIYTEDINHSVPLGDIFMTLKEKYADKVEIDPKSASPKELFEFFATVLPDFDKDRVYPTDIKKIINWYKILFANLPEAFEVQAEAEEKE
ncbi:DUF5606 family protein [Lacihabitans lacunae]|mgnify:CR=1 FL=1|jgi:hypothetical protein|uniref:DUF5606 domain-containing protein n=1 Tax=Lacihabitans lacunae TaxID=1028214 RepID=A0ABV7Z099_9BACT